MAADPYEIVVVGQRAAKPVDLSRVPVLYAFELYVGGELVRVSTLPNGPSRVQIEPVFAGSVNYTFGDTPDRQHTAPRRWNITCLGRSGMEQRQRYSRVGKIQTMSGGQSVTEFDAFLQNYQTLAAAAGGTYLKDPDKYREKRDNCYLVFRAYAEQYHLKVELPSQGAWRFWRSIEEARLGSFMWTLQLHGYADAGRTPMPAVLGSVKANQAAAADFLGKVDAKVKAATSGLNKGLSAAAAGVGTATTAAKRIDKTLQRLQAPAQRLTALAVECRRFVAQAGKVAAFPRRLLLDLAVAAEQFRAALLDVKSAGYDFTHGTSAAAKRLAAAHNFAHVLALESTSHYGKLRGGQHEYTSAQAALALASAPGQSPSQATAQQTSAKAPSSVLVYVVQSGDTLQGIAQKTLGNAGAAGIIAQYNGFADAYHGAGGAPLHPGDTILVPGAGAGADVPSLLAGDIYGTDLALDENGDLALATSSLPYQTADGFVVLPAGATDVLTINGDDNLRQAVLNRMRTPRGRCRAFPGYGLLSGLGGAVPNGDAVQAAADIREQMLQDARIADVVDILVDTSGDGENVEMSLIPVAGAAIGLVAPVASL